VSDTDKPFVHFFFAIMTFGCIDAYIVHLYLQSKHSSVLQSASMAATILSKVRFVPTSWLGAAALCIFEWIDSVSIYAFLTSYVCTVCPDEEICIKSSSNSSLKDECCSDRDPGFVHQEAARHA
jgi:hypothetical protein